MTRVRGNKYKLYQQSHRLNWCKGVYIKQQINLFGKMKANRTHTRLSLAATTCQKQQVKICQTALLDYSKGTDILLQFLSVQVAEKKNVSTNKRQQSQYVTQCWFFFTPHVSGSCTSETITAHATISQVKLLQTVKEKHLKPAKLKPTSTCPTFVK